MNLLTYKNFANFKLRILSIFFSGLFLFSCIGSAEKEKLIATAIRNSDLSQLQNYLDQGWDLNAQWGNGETSLILASKMGQVAVLDFLLASGANIHLTDSQERDALYHAVLSQNVEIIIRCLDFWANPLIEDRTGVSAYQAAQKSNSVAVFKAFLDWEKKQKEMKNGPLLIAVRRKNLVNVKSLIAKSSNINIKNKYGETPLFSAVRQGNSAMVKVLLENGAKISGKDRMQKTIWEVAVKRSNSEIIKILNEAKGKKLGLQNIQVSKLIDKVKLDDVLEVEKLLQEGADIESQDSKGWTPLIYANSLEMVKLLIKYGANVNARAEHYLNPLFSAAYDGNLDKFKYLLKNGADIKLKMVDGASLLMAAVSGGNKELIKDLIAKGVDINAKTHYGKTAIMLAKYKGEKKIIDMLVDAGALE